MSLSFRTEELPPEFDAQWIAQACAVVLRNAHGVTHDDTDLLMELIDDATGSGSLFAAARVYLEEARDACGVENISEVCFAACDVWAMWDAICEERQCDV